MPTDVSHAECASVPRGSAAARITWRETVGRFRQDVQRFSEVSGLTTTGRQILTVCYPGIVACLLYRLSHWCYGRGWKGSARIFWFWNIVLTGADISPLARIEGGLYIPHTVALVINGELGRNVTCLAQAGIGGGILEVDVGGGQGLPVIGDEVVIGARSSILGPVRVGSRAKIG